MRALVAILTIFAVIGVTLFGAYLFWDAYSSPTVTTSVDIEESASEPFLVIPVADQLSAAGYTASGSPIQADDNTTRQRWALAGADMPIVTTISLPGTPGVYILRSVEVVPPVGYADFWCVPIDKEGSMAYDLKSLVDECNGLAGAVTDGSRVPMTSDALPNTQTVTGDLGVKAYAQK